MEIIKNIFFRIRNSNKSIDVLVYIFFVLFSILLLKNILISPGLIIGEDSAYPLTSIQIKSLFDIGRYSWEYNSFISYRNAFVGSAITIQTIQYILSTIGITGDVFVKVFITFLYSFASIAIYELLIFLKIKRIPAILSGIFYITTPLFFDYTIFGWHFVLFTMCTLPFVVKYFIKAVRENSIRYTIITGIIFAISFVQSQVIVWFPLVFFIFALYLVDDKKSLITYIKTVSTIFLLFIFLNLHTLLNLFLIPDKAISGSDYINAGASLGTVAFFYPLNVIRLWGSLFNYQYETIIGKFNLPILIFLSFLTPIFIISTLFIKKNKKLIITFFLISLIPIAMSFLRLHREWLAHIPFSNLIRDFARFSIFSAFAYAVLLGIFFNNFVFSNKKNIKIRYVIFFSFILLWSIYLMPWWKGELTEWSHKKIVDSRLSTQVFPNEFFATENELSRKKLDIKVIYLPPSFNGVVQYEDDPKYKDGVRDIFAIFSPIPGLLTTTDRNLGPTQYIDLVENSLESSFLDVIQNTNVKLLIVRKKLRNISKSMGKDNKEVVLNNLENEKIKGKLNKIFIGGKIDIYKKINFLPHFYTPQKIISTNQNLDILPKIVSEKDYATRSVIFFNKNKVNTQTKSVVKFNPKTLKKEVVKNTPVLEFKKINPTKYRVVVHGAGGKFPLVFSESFHNGWKSYLTTSSPHENEDSGNLLNYKILDGNTEDQAGGKELRIFIDKGWITTLGNGNKKVIKHMKWKDNKETLDYVEKYNIDFISKNFQDTIQNNNLPNGSIFETWFKKPIDDNKNHLMVNGYANSWLLNTDTLCSTQNNCKKNSDGSYDFEMMIEFWPQRLFYIGLFISSTTLFCCLSYLVWSLVRRKKLGITKNV